MYEEIEPGHVLAGKYRVERLLGEGGMGVVVAARHLQLDERTVAPFRLDNYEITVGRFRNFVNNYSRQMIPLPAGKNPNNPSDTGWDTAWNASLDADSNALEAAIQCSDTFQTWTHNAGSAAAESLPINCVTWFEVEAFCIWDGGRFRPKRNGTSLPRAATRSCNTRGAVKLPIARTPTTRAGRRRLLRGTRHRWVNRVGTEAAKGNGPYGQSDLAGNVLEWVQDWYATYSATCDNCANLDASNSFRALRGGRFDLDASYLTTTSRLDLAPGYSQPKTNIGARCARNQ
jgi:sulfatase modifying factor 1